MAFKVLLDDAPALVGGLAGTNSRRSSTSPSPAVVHRHPGAAEGYRRQGENQHFAIEGDAGEELRRELRKRIEAVEFVPLEGLGKFELRVRSQLAPAAPGP